MSEQSPGDAATLLFVPGDRPERFARAAAAGADLVVLDLEDAVAPDRKDAARQHVAEWLAGGHECAVRINAAGTEWYRRDVAAVAAPGRAVMLPKAEDLVVLHELAAALGETGCVLALIETARGVMDARDIAAVPGVRRLAFGSFDFAAQLGVAPADRAALGPARGALVLASAAAGLAGPIDGVTNDLHDGDLLTDDVSHARQLGFTGKLCVHPKQVPVAAAALRPKDAEVGWAQTVLDAVSADGVVAVNGQMIDKPALARACRILRQATERSGQ
ncbi:CoA ester lyase [Amycolatopsis sp. GM8]|uniref:HpcH/HpaI aldolase/citrate lyase family protein n=1 Tax=Amycolatopsis sp. GM8 TaxID=2896530 RepID=UPI001F4648B9|nr:CoA ester lyase [Amycolatopsis sp. GM8]